MKTEKNKQYGIFKKKDGSNTWEPILEWINGEEDYVAEKMFEEVPIIVGENHAWLFNDKIIEDIMLYGISLDKAKIYINISEELDGDSGYFDIDNNLIMRNGDYEFRYDNYFVEVRELEEEEEEEEEL